MKKPRVIAPRRRPIAVGALKSPLAVGRHSSPPSFPIIGIGASAGGLDALEQFLRQVPPQCGMAFVVVQRLDPTQKGMMPELLQRITRMKVMQAKDRAVVQPDCVYVIPPNKDMSLLHGRLHLLVPSAPRGLRLPIDFFFRSLAADQHEHSVGVILSGMGSDGTLGLKAIKEKAGVVLVQDPRSAKFDAMPRSVIDAGLADFVAPAEELAAKLILYQRHLPRIRQPDLPLEAKTLSALEKVVILLRAQSGHDFTLYRRSTLHRRIERRMGIHQIGRISAYVRYLQDNPHELGILFKELLIGVTSFFRDPAAWDYLARKALPALASRRTPGTKLRAWVAGCSTGEEVYSLAMVFKEAMGMVKPIRQVTLQIYATDLDRDAIDRARQGFFPENIAADVSPERLARFFVKEGAGYRVSKEIRAMVVFAVQNLIMDPPFTKLDILSCRNLLIYLAPELQKKLIPMFHYSLNPGGLLFLGSATSLGAASRLFAPLASKERIFRRNESPMTSAPPELPPVFVPVMANRMEAPCPTQPPVVSLQSLAEQVLHEAFVPPAVLVNDQGDILYVSGRTGRYLEPAAGKANWNILAMARDALRYHLSSALHKVKRESGTVSVHGIRIGTDTDPKLVDLTVRALQEPKALRGMVLIVFIDVATAAESGPKPRAEKVPQRNARLAELERELQHAHEEVQANREEMQSSQEELKSANEELQSTNEELQSTNEELTTSKEELQSLNEELQTVNAELQSKLEELSGTNNDMKNLLNSTDIATVFLDNDLQVRRFTPKAKTIIKLIPGDEGRPITDLASDLVYPELADDARHVLQTLVAMEKTVTTRDGRWFTVRHLPYRTTDNRIDGVVITFADVTHAKNVEIGLQTEHREMKVHATAQALKMEDAKHRLQSEIEGRKGQAPRRKPAPGGRTAERGES